MKNFSIIVAFDSQYGIGKLGQIPWKLSLDLKHFKEMTTSVVDKAKTNAIIMGRKTWESLPPRFRPLPGRLNVIMSQQSIDQIPHEVMLAHSFDEALKISNTHITENIYIIGGSQIYQEALKHSFCQRICVTHIKGDFDCDVFFPPLSPQYIPISASEEFSESGIKFHFAEYLKS